MMPVCDAGQPRTHDLIPTEELLTLRPPSPATNLVLELACETFQPPATSLGEGGVLELGSDRSQRLLEAILLRPEPDNGSS